MLSAEYQARIDAAKARAHGRWSEILAAAGADTRVRQRKVLPCPVCRQGEDCFQYTDKFAEGNYHCRKCGPGGGFKLLQALRDWSFHEALSFVEELLGSKPLESSDAAKALRLARRKQALMRRLIDRLWNESFTVKSGDPVDQYLRGRGLGLPRQPLALRCHPALEYFESSGIQDGSRPRRISRYPAMLAQVINPVGQVVGLHRTYLHQGKKLDATDAKKVLMLPDPPGSNGVNANAGCSVRLSEATDELATCEGIETGIAISLGHHKPVWPALNAGNLEKLWIPDSVRRLCIYSDNDADSEFTGQASAYALARRVLRERSRRGPLQVHVFVPKRAGEDWADVWQRRQAANFLRAA